MKNFALVKIETIGREVYDDEMGPTLGYDNIQVFHQIVWMENLKSFLEQFEDREIYRSVQVIAENIEESAFGFGFISAENVFNNDQDHDYNISPFLCQIDSRRKAETISRALNSEVR